MNSAQVLLTLFGVSLLVAIATSSQCDAYCSRSRECRTNDPNNKCQHCYRRENFCVPCLKNSHCDDDMKCSHRQCVPHGSHDDCTSARDCREHDNDQDGILNNLCYNGLCIECLAHHHCEAGRNCINNNCIMPVVAAPAEQPQLREGCSSDMECSLNTIDGNNICHDNTCVQCSTDNHCANGFWCENYACVETTFTGNQDGECRGDGDCPRYCYYGRCVMCRWSADCHHSERCSFNRCVDDSDRIDDDSDDDSK